MQATKRKRLAPPFSHLPLTWVEFNGCQEMNYPARVKNFALCPAKSAQEFIEWLRNLPVEDNMAWFKAIGWVEGYVYCQDERYCTVTAWPGFIKHPPGVNTYLA